MAETNFFEFKPFEKSEADKQKLFAAWMSESVKHHYADSKEFKTLCDNRDYAPDSAYNPESLPYFPVTIFKKLSLRSVPESEITRTVRSSSTTGSTPSTIFLDKITINRQRKALSAILTDFAGPKRKIFVVFDAEETGTASGGDVSSRGSAIRGMFSIAREVHYVLNEKLELDSNKLDSIISNLNSDDELCFFGFTWLLYQILSKKENQKALSKLSALKQQSIVFHIGGWKKLQNLNVSKEEFNTLLSKIFPVTPESVMDLYGMTEQLGTIYPDCSAGYKHVPLYADILIRDTNDFHVLDSGSAGFIQLISPIPHSYPGLSILSDDLGEILGTDDCTCGRKGKYFIFKTRSEKADLKGCGDTLNV